jgi:hypothetical protein
MMKRDMDVIRQIVLAVSDAPVGESISYIENVDAEIFAAHVQLLVEAGLVMAALQGADKNNPNAPMKQTPKAAIVYRLTWDGQEFAAAVLDDNLWNKAKDTFLKPTASWTFGIFVDYLKNEIVNQIPKL